MSASVMSTPPPSAASRPVSAAAFDQSSPSPRHARPARSRRRPRAARTRSPAPARRPASTLKPDSTMTVSSSAGRVATMPPSPAASSVVSQAMPAPSRGRQPRGHVGRDDAGAEEHRVGLARRRLERVHDRLRQPSCERRRRRPRAPSRRRARRACPPSRRRCPSRHERRHLAAERRGLRQHAQAAGRELAVVVVDVDEEPAMARSAFSLRNATTFSAAVAARVLDPQALRLGRRGRDRAHDAARAVAAHAARRARGRPPRASRAACAWRP